MTLSLLQGLRCSAVAIVPAKGPFRLSCPSAQFLLRSRKTRIAGYADVKLAGRRRNVERRGPREHFRGEVSHGRHRRRQPANPAHALQGADCHVGAILRLRSDSIRPCIPIGFGRLFRYCAAIYRSEATKGIFNVSLPVMSCKGLTCGGALAPSFRALIHCSAPSVRAWPRFFSWTLL